MLLARRALVLLVIIDKIKKKENIEEEKTKTVHIHSKHTEKLRRSLSELLSDYRNQKKKNTHTHTSKDALQLIILELMRLAFFSREDGTRTD